MRVSWRRSTLGGLILIGMLAISAAPGLAGARAITRPEARLAVYRWWRGEPARPPIVWQTDIGSARAIVTLRIPFTSPDGCITGIDHYRVAVVRRGDGFRVSALDQRLTGTIDLSCALQ